MKCFILGCILLFGCNFRNSDMKNRKSLPFQRTSFEQVTYKLFEGFDATGNPILKERKIVLKDELVALQEILTDARPYKNQIAPTSIGEIFIRTSKGDTINLQLVFDIAKEKYLRIFYWQDTLYQGNEKFPDFLEGYRN